MHACGVSLAVAEHHSVSWAADLDQDSQGILTSDLCTQLHELVIFSHRHYRGHLAGTQPPSEAGGGGPPRRRTAEADTAGRAPPDEHIEWIALNKGIDC